MSLTANITALAQRIAQAIKPLQYLPAKPADGTYALAVAAGVASWGAPPGLADHAIYIQNPDLYGAGSVIQNAVNAVGVKTNYSIFLNGGQYNETGPITISGATNLQITGVPAGRGQDCFITPGFSISNSTGIRMSNLQVTGATTITSKSGNGSYFADCQFGDITLDGPGYLVFTDCAFNGNVTVASTFTGAVYFIRPNFSLATGAYTFAQASPLYVLMADPTGLVYGTAYNAAISGMATFKAGQQAYYINGYPIASLGATADQLLRFTGTAWTPQTLWRSSTTAARPTTNRSVGQMHFDTTLGKPIWWNGSVWKDATGTTV